MLGQDAFVDGVVRAMRRPFVLGTEPPAARNVVLLCGGAGTGRHFALTETARCMAARGRLRSDQIASLDLALYPNSGAEKLFLQDLYAALYAPGEIVIFEHYESCYPGFLKTISDLAVKGSAPLSSRYLVNKEGILVDAGTALAPGAVSSIDAAASTSSSFPTRAGRQWPIILARHSSRRWEMSAPPPPLHGRIWRHWPPSSSTRWPGKCRPGWA